MDGQTNTLELIEIDYSQYEKLINKIKTVELNHITDLSEETMEHPSIAYFSSMSKLTELQEDI